MTTKTNRRTALKILGAGLATSGLVGNAAAAPDAGATTALMPQGAEALRKLAGTLAAAPRRRDFKTVPMILNDQEQWDAAALDAVLAYPGSAKQSWDNTEIGGPWLNVMRNSMNAQIWSFRHPDFLCVSATHGSAHMALYDQAMWDKYQLAKLAGGGITSNRFVESRPAGSADPTNYEADNGIYSPENNGIVALQRRGAVFLACHNAIWELAARLAPSVNPDHLGVNALAAELTNHLVRDIVLTPGAVATLVELHRAGFAYTR